MKRKENSLLSRLGVSREKNKKINLNSSDKFTP
jgi:hypothetical protein